MNDVVSNETKLARGTFKKSRVVAAIVPADPGEVIPRRPSNLTGYAAKFWKRHLQRLWDSGRISMGQIPGFELLCDSYKSMRELEDAVKDVGSFYQIKTQFSKKWVETPQNFALQRERKTYFKFMSDYGMTSVSSKRMPPAKPREKGKVLSLGDFMERGNRK